MHRLLVHADTFRGVDDGDGQIFVFEMLVEQIADFGLRADQVDSNGEHTARKNCPTNLRFGGLVTAECVQRYVDEHGGSSSGYRVSFTSRTARPL
jgi:hypothetical protein